MQIHIRFLHVIQRICILIQVYLFYSWQHEQWRIGTNYEGPKASGCLIYICSKEKDPIRIGSEQKQKETRWFETDGNSKCNWVPVDDLKIFSCPRRISLTGKNKLF